MLRKLMLATVASLGLLAPLAVAPKAAAHERRVEHVYRVYYRGVHHRGWSCAATFHGHREAERFAAQYRCRGFQVSIW